MLKPRSFIFASAAVTVCSVSQQFLFANAFLPRSISDRTSQRIKSSSEYLRHSLHLQMIQWEDVVYHAESVANNLALTSLEDPSNLATSLPIMYGAGLLTSVSPCVWGLLPLTISYISQAAGERKDRQTALPTLAFAAGLAVVFCTLGVLAAQLGGVFGGQSEGMNVLPLFSNTICLVMGLKLLELVDFELPSLDIIRPKKKATDEPILIDSSGQILDKKTEDGSLVRTFLLGGSSALVASPCATPVLTSILGFVAKAQNPVLGGLLLLGYTVGYSTPLLIVASTGGQALVELRSQTGKDTFYARLAPWVTPFTGGILLWYGMNGILYALFGDPSLAGLAPVIE